MDWAFHESQSASTFAQSAKNMSGYSSTGCPASTILSVRVASLSNVTEKGLL
jgi:hypothetical protein